MERAPQSPSATSAHPINPSRYMRRLLFEVLSLIADSRRPRHSGRPASISRSRTSCAGRSFMAACRALFDGAATRSGFISCGSSRAATGGSGRKAVPRPPAPGAKPEKVSPAQVDSAGAFVTTGRDRATAGTWPSNTMATSTSPTRRPEIRAVSPRPSPASTTLRLPLTRAASSSSATTTSIRST